MDELKQVFDTNAFGALAVTQAMLPLLRQAAAARIVMVSSGAGSLSAHADPNFSMRKHFGAVYGPTGTFSGFTLSGENGPNPW